MAYPTPVVTVRPRYEPSMMTRTRLPATAIKRPAPRGTGSRRLTRCTPERPPNRPADESAGGPEAPGPEGAAPEAAAPEDAGPEDAGPEDAGPEGAGCEGAGPEMVPRS